MKKNLLKIFCLILCMGMLSSCANFGRKMKNLVSGKSTPEQSQVNKGPMVPSYSAGENLDYRGIPRAYKRMTQAKLESENKIGEASGSLWMDEGQSSYLFAQNNQRLEGDIINVEIEGTAKKQLDTKVSVINKLIAERKANSQAAMIAKRAPANAKGEPAPQKQDNTPAPTNPASEKKEAKSMFSVKEVPSRIVESFPDGSYRVRGSKDFMIGRHEYKVIVTGMVRPGDIADNKVKSDQILDSKFDIVSLRRNLKL